MRTLHVASAQIVSRGGASETLPRIDAVSQSAALLGADVILFAEVSIHGYDYGMTRASVQAVAETADGDSVQRVRAMARRHGITILAGFFEREADRIYNSHLIAKPDGCPRVQRKHQLTAGELGAGLVPGPRERHVFTLNGVRCAVLICADTGIADMPATLREQRVELRFIPTGGGGKWSDMPAMESLDTEAGRRRYAANRPTVCRADAFDAGFAEWGIAYVSANALGPAGVDTCHQGHCIIVDRQGVLRAQAVGTIVREHMHEQLINAVLHWPD